jgi:hypothetical protein
MPQLGGQPGAPERAAFCEGGYNRNEPQAFEPMADFESPANIYYPKVKLQNEHPEMVTRATMIRTLDYELVARPDGQSEFYDLRTDPKELRNACGERAYGAPQEQLRARMLDWYIRTADVAPEEHGPRGFPKKMVGEAGRAPFFSNREPKGNPRGSAVEPSYFAIQV